MHASCPLLALSLGMVVSACDRCTPDPSEPGPTPHVCAAGSVDRFEKLVYHVNEFSGFGGTLYLHATGSARYEANSNATADVPSVGSYATTLPAASVRAVRASLKEADFEHYPDYGELVFHTEGSRALTLFGPGGECGKTIADSELPRRGRAFVRVLDGLVAEVRRHPAESLELRARNPRLAGNELSIEAHFCQTGARPVSLSRLSYGESYLEIDPTLANALVRVTRIEPLDPNPPEGDAARQLATGACFRYRMFAPRPLGRESFGVRIWVKLEGTPAMESYRSDLRSGRIVATLEP